jgi:hypothetical protein
MSAQSWSVATTLGSQFTQMRINPERVHSVANPFRVDSQVRWIKPRVLATLEPWAEISERLRRIFVCFSIPQNKLLTATGEMLHK